MKKEKICGIYKITSPTGKVYIGESSNINRRVKNYQVHRCKAQIKLYSSLEKYGWENHIFEVIEECAFEDLFCRERYWQDFHEVLGEKGMNLKLTEYGEKKLIYSEETLKKMSNAKKGEKCFFYGKHHTEETKQKISHSNKGKEGSFKGKKHSEETINKMREAQLGEKHHFYGKTQSEETKKKISESTKGEKSAWFNKKHTEESKEKISQSRLKYYENNPPKTGKEHHTFIDKVGEKYDTVNSGIIEIIDYINNNNCTIRFENGLIRENVQYRLIKKGYIGNPNKIKITEEQRAEIRLKYPDTKMAQLSLEYNTSIATVSNIINNKK